MGKQSLKRKLKMETVDRLDNPPNSKEKNRKSKEENKGGIQKTNAAKKRSKSTQQTRGKQGTQNQVDADQVGQLGFEANTATEVKKRRKLSRKKKSKDEKIIEVAYGRVEQQYNGMDNGYDGQNGASDTGEGEKSRSKKKRRKDEKKKKDSVDEVDELCDAGEDDSIKQNVKSKNTRKIKKTDHTLSEMEKVKVLETRDVAEQEGVYEISSGDEDYARGMKKWIMEYQQSRFGLKILQQRIDDFITAYEEKQELERKEREAQVAEGGWTVVVHHKGRKKTTDSESGIAVGSVAQASVLDKMTKKKNKEVGLDFYRFQKREAHRNEVMMLQSKFEQDKKRIQQLRAARKFRPY